MKKRIIWFFQFIAALGILAILGWASYVILGKVWAGFSTLPSGAKIAAVGGLITLASVLVTRYYERRKDIEAKLRERKLEAYSSFLEAYFQQLFEEERKPDFNFIAELRRFVRGIILWGNPGVIKALVSVRLQISTATTLKSLELYEALLKEIRKDLGNSNWQLKQYDLSRLFINDIDQLKAENTSSNPSIKEVTHK